MDHTPQNCCSFAEAPLSTYREQPDWNGYGAQGGGRWWGGWKGRGVRRRSQQIGYYLYLLPRPARLRSLISSMSLKFCPAPASTVPLSPVRLLHCYLLTLQQFTILAIPTFEHLRHKISDDWRRSFRGCIHPTTTLQHKGRFTLF